MKIHDEIDEWMAGALCDALSPEEQQNFERHLAECPHCRSLYEENQKMNSLLKDTLHELRPDPNFEGRLIAGFRERTSQGWFQRLSGTVIWLIQLRSAQAVLTVLMLVAMVKGGMLLTGERYGTSTIDAIAKDSTRAFRVQSFVPEVVSWSEKEAEKRSSHGKLALGDLSISNGGAKIDSLAKNGAGTVRLGGANSYTGATTLNGGTLGLSGGTISNSNSSNYDFQGGDIPQAGRAFSFDHSHASVSFSTDASAQNKLGLGSDSGDLGFKSKEGNAGTMDSPTQAVAGTPSSPADARKLIRNATLEIEVAEFDKAAETIVAVAKEEQSYVNTQDSERGANGKLQGRIVVKVLPANLDRFLLKLRSLGELKNQTIGTNDVTKAYFDTDARLRNSRRMEERLLDMLKKGAGKVSDLLQVEKELGRVREQIEQMQGELKYYDVMAAYATVTISLREKDLAQPAAYLLRERASLSLFSKDVEKAFADAKKEAEAAKAQTVQSNIERDANGRITATLRLLISPEASDGAIDRLKTLGRIQNFTSQTERIASGGSRDGTGNSDAARIERDKVELNLTIQRDEEQAAQQTSMGLQTDRVEEKVAMVKQQAASAGAAVKASAFNREANGAEVSNILLRMPMHKYAAFLEQVRTLGKVRDFTVSRNDDAQAGENAPVEIALRIYSQADLVADDTGFFSTIRKTLSQAFAALMWSLRMIGVSLAFVAPWAIAISGVIWLVARRRRTMK